MSKPLVFIDSGVGGITVLRETLSLQSFEEVIYLADQKYFPYGERSAGWIERRTEKLISWASSFNPCSVVVACNTISSNSTQDIKTAGAKVIGVDPVIKDLSKYKNPLLLATSATLKSKRIRDLKKKYGRSLETYAPTGLASAIEDMDKKAILHEIEKIRKAYSPDAIGLSCTHYPLVKEEFEKAFPDTLIIDPSLAVSRVVISECTSDFKGKGSINWYTTSSVARFKNQVKNYYGQGGEFKEVNI